MAEPEEVSALRRVIRARLQAWGLHGVTDEAELCLSELVSNVITHVGVGTPATLAVSMNGARLRLEVHDPDTRALPTLNAASSDDETGRGMALVGALADCWGVQLSAGRKVTWCELPTGLTFMHEPFGSARVVQGVDAVLGFYDAVHPPRAAAPDTHEAAVAEEQAIDVIAAVLHRLWLRGRNPDKVLNRAQKRFEVVVSSHPTA